MDSTDVCGGEALGADAPRGTGSLGSTERTEVCQQVIRKVELRAALGSVGPSARCALVRGERTDTLLDQWVRSAGIPYGIDRADALWPSKGARKLLGSTLHPMVGDATYSEAIYVLHTYVALTSVPPAASAVRAQSRRSRLDAAGSPAA